MAKNVLVKIDEQVNGKKVVVYMKGSLFAALRLLLLKELEYALD